MAVEYLNPFSFVVFGMGSGLVWAMSLHFVFAYIGAGKGLASKLGG